MSKNLKPTDQVLLNLLLLYCNIVNDFNKINTITYAINNIIPKSRKSEMKKRLNKLWDENIKYNDKKADT